MTRETVVSPLENSEAVSVPTFFDEDETPEDIALQNVISEFGADGANGKVNVYRTSPGKPLAFVKSYSPMEFSLETLQAEYGPGDYQVRVYGPGGLKARKNIVIDKPLNSPQFPVAVQAQQNDRLIEVMNQGFTRMAEMFAGAMSKFADNQPKPKTAMETLQELQMMKEIMGVNNNPAPSVDPLQMIETALALADKINPRPAGENDLLLEGLKAFAPLATAALQHAPAQTSPSTGAISSPQVLAAPAPAQSAAPAALQVAQPENKESEMLKYYVWLLVQNAALDNDPVTYANLFIDTAGTEGAKTFCESPDWFERICALQPDAAKYREWFEEMRADVLELTKPDSPDNSGDITSETPPQNAPLDKPAA